MLTYRPYPAKHISNKTAVKLYYYKEGGIIEYRECIGFFFRDAKKM